MTRLTSELYTATASSTGGRSGRATTDDGLVDARLATPVEMGGPGGATNPEQLLAAAYAASFQDTLEEVAAGTAVDVSHSLVTTKITLGTVEEGGYGLKVSIAVTMPGADADTARRLAETAHELCPYSRATRGNIEVTLDPA